ncbi:MAG: hypothetical protein EPN25_14810 [Nitrospirae bacterium]|nr:MAG: hypothetical protein EPN25_14810 [Nitrospirota bacterium]
MKRSRLALLLVMAMVIGLTGFVSESSAGVRVGIGINLPVFTFAEPPSLVVIPGTYVYAPVDADIDIVFYQGYWYRPYEGGWFRARSYNGPWRHIPRAPRVLIDLPPDYRHRYRDHSRIEYRDFNRHWRGWERNKHWERNERWREGRERREDRRERREDRREHREDRREDRRDHREHRGR